MTLRSMLNSVAEIFWMPFASAGSSPGAPPFAGAAGALSAGYATTGRSGCLKSRP